MFEVAYFWRVHPASMQQLTLDEFAQYEAQAQRIAELIKPEE